MPKTGGKIVIVGGGIAGLCAAVYAQKSGYQVQVLEMHDMAGGLAMSWRRGAYTFETCLHWLYGSNPNRAMFRLWREVFDIEKLSFVDPGEFARIETEGGDTLAIPTNVDLLEKEFLRRSPQDAPHIHHLASTIGRLSNLKCPIPPKAGSATRPFCFAILLACPRYAKSPKSPRANTASDLPIRSSKTSSPVAMSASFPRSP
jgi:phytoene dehydrogenase-like protein